MKRLFARSNGLRLVIALTAVAAISTGYTARAATPVISSGKAPATGPVSIGVDHTPPRGHDFQYVDFFPRARVNIHTGTVVGFHWNASPDGFHTTTLLKTGETVAQALAAHPLVVPDSDDGTQALQLNPAILAPTNPPGSPGACGDAAHPCPFSGRQDLNSGANPTDGHASFYAQINLPAPATLTFMCEVHPGMSGVLHVVPDSQPATTPAQVAAAAAAQARADTSGALAAEAAAIHRSTTTGSTGHRTVTAVAGTATRHVEVVEFLPGHVTIRAGDTVRWTTKTIKDIHTITFPLGTRQADPIPNVCEASPADTPAPVGPTGPSCTNPAALETHFLPRPAGSATITSTTQVASSGVLSQPPAPFPSTYAYTFPVAGRFQFFCHIHENGMKGVVTVTPAGGP